LVCEAGNDTNDFNSPAQDLADALKRKGGNNTVYASPDLLKPTTPEIYKALNKWNKFKGK
jgi:hypothetical protein